MDFQSIIPPLYGIVVTELIACLLQGPGFWGLINPHWNMCAKGRRQSPINVDPDKLLFDPYLRPLHIDKHKVSFCDFQRLRTQTYFRFTLYFFSSVRYSREMENNDVPPLSHTNRLDFRNTSQHWPVVSVSCGTGREV